MAYSTLLPEGFYDLLPPDAHRQRQLYLQVMAIFESFGYEEVSPPFMEFDRSLLRGGAGVLAPRTFRLMDPLSREMVGLRTDMTPQIARIAAARLQTKSKPLRLCYGGTCFDVSGEGLQKNRQFQQAGVELIGSHNEAADQEMLRCAATVLHRTTDAEVTVDISLPGLPAALVEACPPQDQERLQRALEQKDKHSIAALAIPFADAISALVTYQGATPDWQGWQNATTKLPEKAARLLQGWITRCKPLRETEKHLPLRLSFDPLDSAKQGYHCEIAFSFFIAGQEEEVGRGGRYLLNDETPAIGFTLLLKRLERLQRPSETPMRCYICFSNTEEDGQRLREKGWVTLYALEKEDADAALANARKNRCSHLLRDGKLQPVG